MSSETVWIGTSWKMNKSIGEAREYIAELLAAPQPSAKVQVFVLPAHTALAAVHDDLPPSAPLLLGAQNAHWRPEGAGTGEVSMRMIKDAGARIVEIGHSERREAFCETDETVALKARAALDHGLIPLICLGESVAERDDGRADDYVARQFDAATALLTPNELSDVLIAYEPIWAIGAGGRPATVPEVVPIMATLSQALDSRSSTGRCRALLYGGGVDAGNAADFLSEPHIEGLFVGRAAWSARGLLELVAIGASYGGS